MSLILAIHPAAKDEVDEAVAWHNQYSISHGDRFLSAFIARRNQCLESPDIWRADPDIPGVHSAPIQGTRKPVMGNRISSFCPQTRLLA